MEFQKIITFLDTMLNDKDLPRLLLKHWLKFMINQEKITVLTKKLESKRQCLDFSGFSDAYIVVKGNIIVTNRDSAKRNKAVAFK